MLLSSIYKKSLIKYLIVSTCGLFARVPLVVDNEDCTKPTDIYSVGKIWRILC
jgi:hypothetical protein